jgi:hypothetical protein
VNRIQKPRAYLQNLQKGMDRGLILEKRRGLFSKDTGILVKGELFLNGKRRGPSP